MTDPFHLAKYFPPRMARSYGVARSIVIALIAMSCVACSGGSTKVNSSLATEACQDVDTLLSNAPGLLGGSGAPSDPSALFNTTSADAKASADKDLSTAVVQVGPFILGSYVPPTTAAGRTDFTTAEGKVDNLDPLCSAFGVSLPQVGAPSGG